jgi:hypothetical protein
VNHPFRKRIPSEPVIKADLSAAHGSVGLQPTGNPASVNTQSGALSRVMAGVFGTGGPGTDSSSEVRPAGDSMPNRTPTGFYHFHEGDVFTPGTANYVFEPTLELTPVTPVWGHAFLRRPNSFSPLQPSQSMSYPNVQINGIGGIVAGQFVLQPLESTGQ